MKVLIIDDHFLIREALGGVFKELKGEAADVIEAPDSHQAIQQMELNPDVELVLLDLGLPDRNGFEVLTELSERWPTVPVVVHSAHQDHDSVMKALDFGAVGFIPKSAQRHVLLAAFNIVFSGGIYIPPEILNRRRRDTVAAQHGPTPPKPRVSAADLGLTDRQMEVLALMMLGKSNKAICRVLDLAETTVKIHVSAILKSLKVTNRTEAVIAATALGLQPPPRTDQPSSRLVTQQPSPAQARQSSRASSTLPDRASIAVLPFTNMSSDPEQEYFADGIVEDIITALSRFRTFAVVARNSTFAYKGRAADVRTVARDLGVRYVLEGGVRRSSGKVRVTAQLIEGAGGAHLWAEKFEGAIADIFEIQDEITRSVIGLIEPQIRRAEIERARRKPPESVDAWDLYIQALPLVYGANVSAYSDAIVLLERAITLAPNYTPALALASWAHERRNTQGGTPPPGVDDVVTSLALAQRALDADPDDALAMALLGWVRITFRLDYSGLALCSRAVELNPNNRAVLDLAGVAHKFAGDLDEVIACGMRALRLSPGASDSYLCLKHIADAHFFAGRFEEAAECAQRSIDLEKGFAFGHLSLAVIHAHLGRVEKAQAAMKVALTLRPDLTIAKAEKWPFRFPERRKLWADGWRMAGMPEG